MSFAPPPVNWTIDAHVNLTARGELSRAADGEVDRMSTCWKRGVCPTCRPMAADARKPFWAARLSQKPKQSR